MIDYYPNKKTQNLRSYWILDYGNPLYDGGNAPNTDAGRTAFANWAVASMNHFKGNGIIWELWNEPNIGFWKPTPSASDYAKLAVAVGQAMDKAGGLDAEIFVGPATSGMDYTYLEAVFQGGVLQYFDAVSVHPYRPGSQSPETVIPNYGQLNTLIQKYNPNKPQPIISGEWGYTTCDACNPDYNNQVHVTTQAKYLARQWLINALSNVGVSIWYDWRNDSPNRSDPEGNFGTVENAYHNSSQPYTPKPSYTAAVTIQSAIPPASYSFRSRINGMINGQIDNNAYVLTFGKSGSSSTSAYAVWKSEPSVTCANVAADARIDCGFNGITQTDCQYRGCCFENPYVGPGPQCYFQQTSALLNFSTSTSGTTCFKAINYMGTVINANLCPTNGAISVTASDGPIYLVS